MAAAGDSMLNSRAVRVVVAGDRGTGKSSLIVTVENVFPASVPPVLPLTKLRKDCFPERVPVTIVDTGIEYRGKLEEELMQADVVVLTYACDQPLTLDRLSTYWLPELRRLEVNVPVVVVGCKLDLRNQEEIADLEEVMAPIMQEFREIETCFVCSALRNIQVHEVFFYSQKAVVYPTAPLFDQELQTLKSRCARALKRIFILCDYDRDGALNDVELNYFQVKCFNAPLQPSEIERVKSVVQEQLPEGVNYYGLTLAGFLFLHAFAIESGRIETTWTVLRKFGYNNEVRLDVDQLPNPIKKAPDQSVELTNEAAEFLKEIFSTFDIDGDGVLRIADLKDLFSTAPESPWSRAPYANAAERTILRGLSLEGFLSEWALMTVQDPIYCVEYLIYIGYAGDPSSAIRFTQRRGIDRKKKQSYRSVFQCFVFGPKGAGKSALLKSFIGRPFSDDYVSDTENLYAANTVDQLQGKKTLILREIPEDGVGQLLNNKDALAACDIAVFVYDSSHETSWKKTTDLLLKVASRGEATGYQVPCLIVAAKDDLDPHMAALQDSTRVSQNMGIDSPIPISTKLGDLNNVFMRIIRAAEHPHLNIPETEAMKSRKQYNRSLANVCFSWSCDDACWAGCLPCIATAMKNSSS